MADHSARITAINNILRAGHRVVTVDGTTVTYDFDALRQERRTLMAEDDTHKGRRPPIASADLGGF